MTNEELLTEAKVRFYRQLLDDDTLSQLVIDAVSSGDGETTPAVLLPDFMAEPWQSGDASSAPALGLRLNMSKSTQDGILGITISSYSYLEVVVVSRERNERTLLTTTDSSTFFNGSDALMALDVDSSTRKEAALQFMLLWNEFAQVADSLGAFIDAMSGTFTTEARSYCI